MPSAIASAEPPHPASGQIPPEPPSSLAEVLDRILHRGVSLEGNVTIGVADVELLFLDLRLLLAAVDTVWPDGLPYGPAAPLPDTPAASPGKPAARDSGALAPAFAAPPVRAATSPPGMAAFSAGGAPPRPADPASGLVRLVLTLVKLLHDLLERLAVRRMSGGRLSAAQIDRVGSALQAQAAEIERLRRAFGLAERDLALNFGRPAGAM